MQAGIAPRTEHDGRSRNGSLVSSDGRSHSRSSDAAAEPSAETSGSTAVRREASSGSPPPAGSPGSPGGEGAPASTEWAVGDTATALLVLAALCDGHEAGQEACLSVGLLAQCAAGLRAKHAVVRCWSALCLSRLVQSNEHAAAASLDEHLLPPRARWTCLLYTSPSPRDRQKSRMPSSA